MVSFFSGFGGCSASLILCSMAFPIHLYYITSNFPFPSNIPYTLDTTPVPFPAMMLSSMKIILLIADFLHSPNPKNYGLFFEEHRFTSNHGLILKISTIRHTTTDLSSLHIKYLMLLSICDRKMLARESLALLQQRIPCCSVFCHPGLGHVTSPNT